MPTSEPTQPTAVMVSGTVPVPDPTVLTTQAIDRALAAYREIVEARLNAMDKAVDLTAVSVEKSIEAARDAREIIRAEFEKSIISQREVVETRLSGMDVAVQLLAADLLKIREQQAGELAHSRHDADKERLALRELLEGMIAVVKQVTDEKLAAVDTRFLERDTRTEQAAQESRISLDAALAAAKEAVSEQNKANNEKIAKSELGTVKQIDSLIALMNSGFKSLEDKYSDLKSRIDRGEGQGQGEVSAHSESRLNVGQILVALIVVLSAISIVVAVVLH